jgi:hypothetical protein
MSSCIWRDERAHLFAGMEPSSFCQRGQLFVQSLSIIAFPRRLDSIPSCYEILLTAHLFIFDAFPTWRAALSRNDWKERSNKIYFRAHSHSESAFLSASFQGNHRKKYPSNGLHLFAVRSGLLQFLMENRGRVNSCPMLARDKSPSIMWCVHQEVFEPYPILLPLKGFLLTIESRLCTPLALVRRCAMSCGTVWTSSNSGWAPATLATAGELWFVQCRQWR